ncbi:MAG TPA: hypothetical protein VH601_21245 [Bryobacteraceae bacterium]|jgi:hypothetical protein
MPKYFWLALTLVAGLALPAEGQYPGQTPYPPGQYPGGRPPGGSGIPIPSRGHKNKQKQADTSAPTISADAQTVSNDGKKLVAATSDGRTLTMSITPQTKFTRAGSDIAPSNIVPRTTIHVQAAEDDEANLTAVTVDLIKDAPPESPAEKQAGPETSAKSTDDEEMTRPTILDNPVDVPNRPVLRRGKPESTAPADNHPDTRLSSNQAPMKQAPEATPQTQSDSTDFTIDGNTAPVKSTSASQQLIDRTKDWAARFTEGLPNFVCSQMTTRYIEQSKATGWEPLDIITAKVVYEDGKESYKEITVGGKRTNKNMMELGGSTSTGEFASTLHSLFSEASRAEFKLYQSTTISGTPAKVYDFKVALPNSDWFINVGGQSLRPAYSGSVWIDRETAQVRRIEMQADNIPKDFPLDSIQWAVDYDSVRLGTMTFLLPVHAENLGCQRGTPICTKNTVDFRDYHKYSGESTITFK